MLWGMLPTFEVSFVTPRVSAIFPNLFMNPCALTGRWCVCNWTIGSGTMGVFIKMKFIYVLVLLDGLGPLQMTLLLQRCIPVNGFRAFMNMDRIKCMKADGWIYVQIYLYCTSCFNSDCHYNGDVHPLFKLPRCTLSLVLRKGWVMKWHKSVIL